MNQIKKYIERLKQLQSLYEVGQPQHNAFGIAIDEANEMLVKNCIKPAVIKSVCDHNWKEWEDENCNAQMRCTKCKTVKQTVL